MFLDLSHPIEAPTVELSPDEAMAREFLAFCRSKPAGEAYEFWDCDECPVTQFGRHSGLITSKDSFGFSNALLALHLRQDAALRSRPWTFGQLATRLATSLGQPS